MENKLIYKEYYLLKLNKRTLKTLINCLDYCYHRAIKHETPVTPYAENIDKLRELLKN